MSKRCVHLIEQNTSDAHDFGCDLEMPFVCEHCPIPESERLSAEVADALERIKTLEKENIDLRSSYRNEQENLRQTRARAYSSIEHVGGDARHKIQVAKEYVRGIRSCLR